MNYIVKIFTATALLFLTNYVNASCLNIDAQGDILIDESHFSSNQACVNISNITVGNTVITADSQMPGVTTSNTPEYMIKVESGNQQIIQKTISDTPQIFKVDSNGNDSIKLSFTKTPNNSYLKHAYSITVSKESFGLTVIYITPQLVDSMFVGSYIPEEPICDNQYGTCVVPASAVWQHFSFTEAKECSIYNRPPSPTLEHKKVKNVYFDLNDALRKEKSFKDQVQNFVTTNYHGVNGAQLAMHARALTFTRLYNNHKTGAVYDVKNAKSVWAGDADYGNFLFGAVMAVHSFTMDETLRYSAAYQAISTNGYWGAPLGLYNYFTNSGDNPGDPEMLSRGHNYATQVFANNPNDSENQSCMDANTKANIETSLAISGSGGDLPTTDNGYNYSRYTVTCQLWQFPDGNGGYYQMYRECNYWLVP